MTTSNPKNTFNTEERLSYKSLVKPGYPFDPFGKLFDFLSLAIIKSTICLCFMHEMVTVRRHGVGVEMMMIDVEVVGIEVYHIAIVAY